MFTQNSFILKLSFSELKTKIIGNFTDKRGFKMSLNSSQMNSLSNSNLSIDETKTQLQEYLIKLIELVPNLKQQQQIATHINGNTSIQSDSRQLSAVASNFSCLEQLDNLDLNSKELSDLQILQSVLDYIVELKAEIFSAEKRE